MELTTKDKLCLLFWITTLALLVAFSLDFVVKIPDSRATELLNNRN